MEGWEQRCAGTYLTTGVWGERKPGFVAFASFCGVNTPSPADCRQGYQHDTVEGEDGWRCAYPALPVSTRGSCVPLAGGEDA